MAYRFEMNNSYVAVGCQQSAVGWKSAASKSKPIRFSKAI